MLDLTPATDAGLLFLRVMTGAIFADSGRRDLTDPDARSKSIDMSRGFTIFLGVAEIAGAAGIIFGVLQQLAAIGLIVLMLGAIQKKMQVWKTGFWGKEGPGWYYELTLTSILFVLLVTNGGRYVLTH